MIRLPLLYVTLVVLRSRPSFFFFNDTATTEIYTLSLHDALPISCLASPGSAPDRGGFFPGRTPGRRSEEHTSELSHMSISYAVFCLKKKKKRQTARAGRDSNKAEDRVIRQAPIP